MAKDYSNRQTKRDIIDEEYYYSGNLEDMIKDLQDILDRNPGKVIKVDYATIREDAGWHTEYGYQHSIYIERLENDAEYEARIEEEKRRNAQREENERKQLEALKKKYG